MKREDVGLQRALGRLVMAIQAEEMRAIDTPAWRETHAALGHAESLYWSAKQAALAQTLGTRTIREYLGLAWLSRHPRVLPALQELELSLEDIADQA
jgi:hypothetical protein